MLFYSTIAPKTLRLLKALQDLDALRDFILVGGTSLALQIGHRISIDLDLFPDGSDFLVYKSLLYFEDAEIEPMPKMIQPIKWEDVKNKIIIEVKKHFP